MDVKPLPGQVALDMGGDIVMWERDVPGRLAGGSGDGRRFGGCVSGIDSEPTGERASRGLSIGFSWVRGIANVSLRLCWAPTSMVERTSDIIEREVTEETMMGLSE